MDISFVTERLATGAALTPADIPALQSAGITHVIVCDAGENDAAFLTPAGIAVLENGVDDDGQPKPVSWFQSSLAFALPALMAPKVKVLAHCGAGINRGPSTAYAILRALGLSAADAEAQIRKYRPQVGLAYKTSADAAVAALDYCA